VMDTPRDSLLRPLIDACPTFEAHWEEVASIYGGRNYSELPTDEVVPEFCRHMLELFQDARLSCFPPLMRALDSSFESGDSEMKKLIEKVVATAAFDWWDNGVDAESLRLLLPANLKHLCVVGGGHT
jgi:hypothetical protein